MADDRNKYIKMENVLNTINRKYISMSDEEIKRNNQILKAIVELIVNKMKHKDVLFKTMYSNIFYGGSFYDGLRVGNPEEFDLDLLLNLPKLVAPSVTTSNVPGFVHLQLTKYADLLKQKSQAEKYRYFKPANTQMHNICPEYRNDNQNYYYQRQETEQNYYTTTSFKEHTENYYLRRRRQNQRRNARRREFFKTHGGLDKLMDDQYYLVTNKVLRWMEGVVTKALNELDKNGPPYLLCIPQGNLYARICKGGPAFTLKVEGDIQGKKVNMDIDLVPCFVFGPEKWPQNGFKKNPVAKKPNFFIVPKPLKISVGKSVRYWRLSFQEQERELIDGKRTLKPTIKLLKKLRDTMNHSCIASYYIKTVLLWKVAKKEESFWSQPLSYVFVTILKEYHNCFADRKTISYYWNKNNNLIKNVGPDTMSNIANRLKCIIDDIERNPNDEFVVAKYILSPSEMAQLRTEMLGR